MNTFKVNREPEPNQSNTFQEQKSEKYKMSMAEMDETPKEEGFSME
jgi:hypothetical protein